MTGSTPRPEDLMDVAEGTRPAPAARADVRDLPARAGGLAGDDGRRWRTWPCRNRRRSSGIICPRGSGRRSQRRRHDGASWTSWHGGRSCQPAPSPSWCWPWSSACPALVRRSLLTPRSRAASPAELDAPAGQLAAPDSCGRPVAGAHCRSPQGLDWDAATEAGWTTATRLSGSGARPVERCRARDVAPIAAGCAFGEGRIGARVRHRMTGAAVRRLGALAPDSGCVGCAAGVCPAACRASRPPPPGGGVSPAELQRLFDAYVLMQAQDDLSLTTSSTRGFSDA